MSKANWIWHLRQAVEGYLDDTVNGPWDDVIHLLAKVMDEGCITVEQAARLNRALGETLGQAPANCDVCDCPAVGVTHGH